MWMQQIYILEPLTELWGDVSFLLELQQIKIFAEMKEIIALDCMNTYSYLNLPFDINVHKG